MTALKTFINQNMFLTLFAVLITILSATSTYAGFEWVPQKKQAVIDEPEMIQVRPVQQPQTTAIVPLEPLPEDDVVLPLPGNNYVAPPVPVAQAQPIVAAPSMAPPPMPAPLPLTSSAVPGSVATAPTPIAAPTQAPMSIKAPSRIAVKPNEAPNSGVVAPLAPVGSLPPLPEPIVVAQPAPAPRAMSRKELVMPPVDRNNMRIIVPDDAPQSAVDKVQHDRVYISNQPSTEELVHTQTTPMPRVDAPPAHAIPPSQHNQIFTEAVGFAKDVPLALALRQVVPPEYAFSFERGVNPGQRVSWNGGKPWNEVVADMVTPLGYAVRISHKRVVIGTEKAAAASPSFAPPALIEPAAGTEEGISDELPAELAIVDSPAKPADTDIVISSKDAPLAPVTDVERKRDIKRVNITDPGALANVADTDIAPIQIASAVIPPQEEISTTGLTSSLAQNVSQDTSNKVSFWTAEKGASLKDTLIAWSETADTDLVWNATYDFQLPADFEARGNFEKAVELLLRHGVSKDANLGHSLNASSNHERVQIIIDERA